MPSHSKSQQRFFGMLRAIQTGSAKAPSAALAAKARSIGKTDVKHFAATPHKGLPEKVKSAGLQGLPVSATGRLQYKDTADTGGFGPQHDAGNISAMPIDHGPACGWKSPPLRTGNDWRSGASSPFKLRTGAFEPTTPKPLPSAGTPMQPKMAADMHARIAAAEAQVTTPSEKQIETGNYQKGHFTWNGLGITIETAKGQTRSGVNKSTGKAWSVTLKNSYGYIKGTDSAEPGDQMDIFMGPHPESDVVFVVDQNKQDGKTFDEHKCLAGFLNAADAKQAYLDNYSVGWKGFRAITALTIEQFKNWLKQGSVSTPLAGQAFADFHKKAGLPPAGKVAFESMNPFINVKRASGLRSALQTVLGAVAKVPRPSGATMNKALNPWVSSGSVGGDLAKGIGYSGAAAVPTTEFINDHVYGDMMRRHFTGADGLEHKGLDSQSKALELASNTAMLMPLFHRGALRHMVKNPTPALLGKGATTMVIPSIADIFASTENANKATAATADAMQNVGKVAESAAAFAEPMKGFVEPAHQLAKELPGAAEKFLTAMRENRSYATPILSGALGAGLGNMAGHYLEDDGKRLTAAEQTRQKRNRILLTLLGGGVGTVAGLRGAQGLPPLSPSAGESSELASKFQGLLSRIGMKQAFAK